MSRIEFMAEKTATCQPNTVQALLSALRKLQEGLLALGWIHERIVPAEWAVDGHNIPRGAYTLEEAEAIIKRMSERLGVLMGNSPSCKIETVCPENASCQVKSEFCGIAFFPLPVSRASLDQENRLASNDFFPVLVEATCVQRNHAFLRPVVSDLDARGDGVAGENRLEEAEPLVEVNRAGTG